jgi:hypothetical protein
VSLDTNQLMKTRSPASVPWSVLVFCLVFWLGLPAALQSAPRVDAQITDVRIEGQIVVVTVAVPEGLRKITVETRPRFGSGAWQPRAVARIDGQAATITFRIPVSGTLEFLRVRGDATEPLPAGFYEGPSAFGPQPGGAESYYRFGPENAVLDGSAPETGPPTEVVESDIWKLRGDTLYYFNQYRGLQVIDLTDPDHPVLAASLTLPAAGEEMYLLGDTHAVLLARDDCYWGGSGPESRLLIVDVGNLPPRIVATVDVAGHIRESRLVGSVLYVAAQSYRQPAPDRWEWGTLVSSHDLSNPEQPISREAVWFPGWNLTVSATSEFFFVVTPAPESTDRSRIYCLDITAPTGQFSLYATVTARGTVADKFKLNHYEGVLRVASESWNRDQIVNWLETFRLPDPRTASPTAVVRLAEVKLGIGERLFATRFDGARAYLVTYLVIDPLWIFDLSDPQQPVLAGELHVPGWSTYIQPFGDLLLAMGIDDTGGHRAAVSLFTVADPANPALIERVSLGDRYSWSEANQTEKAFTVLPDLNLVLVPYYGGGNYGYASRVQLIDLDLEAQTLELRGEILQPFGARRATVHQDRVISISGTELLTVDIADRDRPQVTAKLPLAWSVDRVFLFGDALIQVSHGNGWNTQGAVHVTLQTEPNQVFATAALPADWPILGAAVRDQYLWILQGLPDGWWREPDPDDPAPEPRHNLLLTSFNLNQVEAGRLPVVGQLEAAVKPLGWGGEFQFLWPAPDLLVLVGGGGGWWRPHWGLWDMPTIGWRYPGWYGGAGGSRLIAIGIHDQDPARLTLRSDLDLARVHENSFSFTGAHQVGPLVYLSHGESLPAEPVEMLNPQTGQVELRDPPPWFQVYRHVLDVIDFTDPDDPTVRPPVGLPGRLEAVDYDGSLVYTIGNRWHPTTDWSYDYLDWLDASAYDGVAVHHVAELPLNPAWWRPALVHRGHLFVGRSANDGVKDPRLETWRLTDHGAFERIGELRLSEALSSLHTVDDLLLGQQGDSLNLIDARDPAALHTLITDRPGGCLWIDPARAVGSRAQGLWFPLGFSGVWHLPVPGPASPP